MSFSRQHIRIKALLCQPFRLITEIRLPDHGPETFTDDTLGLVRQHVAQGFVAHAALLVVADAVALAEVVDLDDGVGHEKLKG